MKKLLFLIPLALAACQSEEPMQTTPPITEEAAMPVINEPAPDDIEVNSYELSRLLNSDISPVKSTSRSTQMHIDTVCNDDGLPLIYIINYGDNEGFVITSAVKTAFPILAYNTVGHYDLENINANTKFVLENMEINVENTLTLPVDSISNNRSLWKSVERTSDVGSRYGVYDDEYDSWPESLKESYQKSVFAMRAVVGTWPQGDYVFLEQPYASWLTNEYIEDVMQAAECYCYLSYITRYQKISAALHKGFLLIDNKIPCCIKSTWDQVSGYNKRFPMINDSTHAYAGCGPVAAGQIMRFYEWPPKYDWANMPYNQGNDTTSYFLLDIAQAAKAKYEIGGTSVTADNLNSAFKAFGYKTDGVKKLESSSQISYCHTKPVVIFGETANSNNIGHVFIACGFSQYQSVQKIYTYTITRPEVFECVGQIQTESFYNENLYINWGYGGEGDGYFNFNYMVVKGTVYNRNLKYLLATPNK